jgi:[acyl-carrier-protein] S-malonyltransferase
VEMRDPEFAVVSNVTAQPVTQAAVARQLLVQQLTSAVRWVASEQAMLAAGVASFVELGPGSVLTGLLKRVDRSVPGRSLGTAQELEDYLAGEG